MNTQSRWLGLLAFLVLAMLAGCGGGGSTTPSNPGGTSGTITFNGGTLDELKALSANLAFDNLVNAIPPKPRSRIFTKMSVAMK